MSNPCSISLLWDQESVPLVVKDVTLLVCVFCVSELVVRVRILAGQTFQLVYISGTDMRSGQA